MEKIKIMGILNVTPDSFSDGGVYNQAELALEKVQQMIADGVDIIDIGGESTRPGGESVSLEEELNRTIDVIGKIREITELPISIDTYKAQVAKRAVCAGATMINDVGGGLFDKDMAVVMAQANVKVVLMHNREPKNEVYVDLIGDIKKELQTSIDVVLEAGVKKENIIVDPGIGFSKNAQQNVEVLRRLDEFHELGYPILLGTSKKRTIDYLLGGAPVDERLIGTVATSCYAVTKNVQYLRVHDVKENKEAVRVMAQLT